MKPKRPLTHPPTRRVQLVPSKRPTVPKRKKRRGR